MIKRESNQIKNKLIKFFFWYGYCALANSIQFLIDYFLSLEFIRFVFFVVPREKKMNANILSNVMNKSILT